MVGKIRDVMAFPSKEGLVTQIEKDTVQIRGILAP